jgi:hypothetical protein
MGVCALLIGLVLTGCGSSTGKAAPPPVPGGVAATAPSSAPAYCRALTGSSALVGLGTAMADLAANRHDQAAAMAVRKAAAALRAAGKQAPAGQGAALTSASDAVRALADHGFKEAIRTERALKRAGVLLEHSCAFPLS